MKLLISIALLAVACGGSTNPAATTEPNAAGPAATAVAGELQNTKSCAAVHGKCVTSEAGASCKTTSADECPVGQVCCNN